MRYAHIVHVPLRSYVIFGIVFRRLYTSSRTSYKRSEKRTFSERPIVNFMVEFSRVPE